MKNLCPSCQRLLYNRRLKSCGFCGAPIPEELRFTPAEIADLDRKTAELEMNRKLRQLAQEATPIAAPPIILPIIIS